MYLLQTKSIVLKRVSSCYVWISLIEPAGCFCQTNTVCYEVSMSIGFFIDANGRLQTPCRL